MRLSKKHWLLNKPIAHRGLWNEDIIENSLKAYKKAVDFGYPIEVDLYSSVDGELFCFHDSTLDRMTGVKGLIFEKTTNQIKSLNLLNSDQKIPTFSELLKLVNGKVPLLIEIKNQPDKNIVDKVVNKLIDYKGEFAIQSFNPLYIKKVKKLAPHFIRGVLGTKTHSKGQSFIKKFMVKNMPLNFIIKPDFISYSFEDLPLSKSKTKNKALITWTITNLNDYLFVKDKADNVIFEKFEMPK